MDINKGKNDQSDLNNAFLKAIEEKQMNELLFCSNNLTSLNKTEQLSDEEVAILWLRIKQNL